MSKEATVGELIQINEDGPANWFRCILVVDEVKPWGVRAYCTVPQASGEPSRDAYRLLRWQEFDCLGAKSFFVTEKV